MWVRRVVRSDAFPDPGRSQPDVASTEALTSATAAQPFTNLPGAGVITNDPSMSSWAQAVVGQGVKIIPGEHPRR